MSAKDITIYLKYFDDDLQFCYHNKNFQPLKEDTITGVDLGVNVDFIVADDSIQKIRKIKVNESKVKGEKADRKFWSLEPEPYKGSNTYFRGTVADNLSDKKPVYNGYTVYYTTKEGDKEKDPKFQYPK